MFARARYKLDIDDKVIQAGRFDNKSTQEEQEEFLVSFLDVHSLNSSSHTYSVLSWKPIKKKRTRKLAT